MENGYTSQKRLLSTRTTWGCYKAPHRAQHLGMQCCQKGLGNAGLQFRLSIWVAGTVPTWHFAFEYHGMFQAYLACSIAVAAVAAGADATPRPTLCPTEPTWCSLELQAWPCSEGFAAPRVSYMVTLELKNVGASLSLLTEISCACCHPGGWKTALTILDAIFSHFTLVIFPRTQSHRIVLFGRDL